MGFRVSHDQLHALEPKSRDRKRQACAGKKRVFCWCGELYLDMYTCTYVRMRLYAYMKVHMHPSLRISFPNDQASNDAIRYVRV